MCVYVCGTMTMQKRYFDSLVTRLLIATVDLNGSQQSKLSHMSHLSQHIDDCLVCWGPNGLQVCNNVTFMTNVAEA